MISIKNTETERKYKWPRSISTYGLLLLLFIICLPVILAYTYMQYSNTQNRQTENLEYYKSYTTNVSDIATRHISNTSQIIRLLEDQEAVRKGMWNLRQLAKKDELYNIKPIDLSTVFYLPYTFRSTFQSPEINSVCIFYDETPAYYYINSNLDISLDRCSYINTLYKDYDFQDGGFVSTSESGYAYYIIDYRNILTNMYTGRCIIEISQIPDNESGFSDIPISMYDYQIDLSIYKNTNYVIYNNSSRIIFSNKTDFIGTPVSTLLPFTPESDGSAQIYKSWVYTTANLESGLTLCVFSDNDPLTLNFVVFIPLILYLLLILLIFWAFFHSYSKAAKAYYEQTREYPMAVPPATTGFLENELLFSVIRERIDDITVLQKEFDGTQLELQKSKLDILEKQLNPHYIFNVLEQINWRAIQDGATDVSILIQSFANMLRNTTDYANNEKTTLRAEVDFLRSYLIFQQKQDHKFEYKFNIDEDLLDDYYVPKYILQPIAENSIIHGFHKNIETNLITLDIWEDADGILIRISDNGVGFNTTLLEAVASDTSFTSNQFVSHLAVQNIRKRLNMMYGEAGSLQISSTLGQGTVSIITIPFDRVPEDR